MFFSSYQNGPDTYLLQVKDSGFPARLREYLGVARQHSAEFQDVRCPIVKERRRFTDVMDEEAEKNREARWVENANFDHYAMGQTFNVLPPFFLSCDRQIVN